jgi:hypothetical protein
VSWSSLGEATAGVDRQFQGASHDDRRQFFGARGTGNGRKRLNAVKGEEMGAEESGVSALGHVDEPDITLALVDREIEASRPDCEFDPARLTGGVVESNELNGPSARRRHGPEGR